MTADEMGPFSRDFDRLEPGVKLVTPGRTITEADLVSFAALTGDWHPQHSDASWAARSRFGERIAHGMLLVSYAVGLLPIDPERVVALRGLRRVVFKRPVRIGETIRVQAEVSDLKPLDDGAGLVALGVEIRNGDGELAVRMTIEAIWRRSVADRAAGNGAVEATAAVEGDGTAPAGDAGGTSAGVGADLSPVADGR